MGILNIISHMSLRETVDLRNRAVNRAIAQYHHEVSECGHSGADIHDAGTREQA
jgi:hypothetical protein